MPSVKKLVVLALACAAIPSVVAFAQSKATKSKNPPSPLAGQPFRPKLDAPTAADWRTIDPQDLLVIDTTKGRVLVELIPEIAPKTVERIKALAAQHFYDGLTFHRVIDGFMAQGGDPAGDGTGGSTLPNIPAEFTFRHTTAAPYVKISAANGVEAGFVKSEPVSGQSSDLAPLTTDGKVNAYGRFCTGTAGFARAGDPDSGNSQFYLMRAPRDQLETMYTVWGRVVSGEDVVKALKTGEPVVNPDKMTSIRVASDLPEGERPKVQIVAADSAWMKTAAKYADDLCDIDLPVKVN
jgi:peptidylprolyl isomerase